MSHEAIPIQITLMPAYYKDFQCLMGGCRDDCCDYAWNIEFSKKDYLKIKQTVKSKETEELLSKGMRRLKKSGSDAQYARFCANDEGKCFFHNPDGLCRLQIECGAEALPHVCRTFPRLDRYTPTAKEYSLTPGCEKVLDILWNLPEGIDFIAEPLDPKNGKIKLYRVSSIVEARFADIRSLCIDVLQERTLTLPQRLLLLGFLLQKLRFLYWDSEEAVEQWLIQGEHLLHDPETAAQLDQLPRNREAFLNFTLEQIRFIDKDAGQELLDSVVEYKEAEKGRTAAGFSGPHYQEMSDKLEELLGHSEYFFENLMVSTAFARGLPNLDSPETMWKSYVELCCLYSLFHVAAVCSCGREVSKEHLFYILVRVGRYTFHAEKFITKMWNDCLAHENASLAYMAVLVGG